RSSTARTSASAADGATRPLAHFYQSDIILIASKHDGLRGVQGSMNKERIARSLPGIPVAIILVAATILLTLATIWFTATVLATATDAEVLRDVVVFTALLILAVGAIFALTGLTPVNPNE